MGEWMNPHCSRVLGMCRCRVGWARRLRGRYMCIPSVCRSHDKRRFSVRFACIRIVISASRVGNGFQGQLEEKKKIGNDVDQKKREAQVKSWKSPRRQLSQTQRSPVQTEIPPTMAQRSSCDCDSRPS
jgi:hypothetical protein